MNDWSQSPSANTARWISREFSELISGLSEDRRKISGEIPEFDILIVGSGYGAAVAASELAGCQSGGQMLRVGVLERGREYLPGAFPSSMAELPAYIRGGIGGKIRPGEGLFDIRGGADVSAVIANGLGGGSLINAGVMEIPDQAVFDGRWPTDLDRGTQLSDHYRRAKRLLGAAFDDVDNTIHTHEEVPQGGLKKSKALKVLQQRKSQFGNSGNFREAAITIAMSKRKTSGGVALDACKLCGDCATGCNYAAKESLDTNLLVSAFRQGAELYCGATVLRVEPTEFESWRVLVTHTDVARRLSEGAARWVSTRRLILSAGTFGSTEILLRSQRHDSRLKFSSQLGKRFSTNGDNITLGYDHGEANAIADEDTLPIGRNIGPTITGIVDADMKATVSSNKRKMVIEELAVPGPLRRIAEEAITSADVLESLVTVDLSTHQNGYPSDDPYAVNSEKLKRTSFYASMGDDGANGALRLVDTIGSNDGDGFLTVDWFEAKNLPLFNAQAQQIAEFSTQAKQGGRTIPNPLLNLVPASMRFLINDARGPVLTVHPLGGCSMADDPTQGVVDQYGRVFKQDGGIYEGLMVLDGSIIPSALGTNPALTITAISLRAVATHKSDWQLTAAPIDQIKNEVRRPVITSPDVQRHPADSTPVKTTAEFQERLSGAIPFTNKGASDEYWVEITLAYPDITLEKLFRSSNKKGSLSDAVLNVGKGGDGQESLLRIYQKSSFKDEDKWNRLKHGDLQAEVREKDFDIHANIYPLTGSLKILKREATTKHQRLRRGLRAWLLNRGARDSYQLTVQWVKQKVGGYAVSGPSIKQRWMGLLQLASHAGEIRRFDYDLTIGKALRTPLKLETTGTKIIGVKRITYARPSNPWRQLQELTILAFPSDLIALRRPVLSLDLRFLAASLAPLFRFTNQVNQVSALMDAVSLGGYFARMLLSIHLWNARAPDLPKKRQIDRLPGLLPGLPAPETHTIDVGNVSGVPIQVLLTRYQSKETAERSKANAALPVLMLHGYSASGTTFAHPVLKPGLARYLAERGRDVWVAELRTSCGLSTASYPWSFEQAALSDIPAAIDYIFWHTGQRPIDIVAHCMGAAMFSMALLSANQSANDVMGPRAQDNVDRFRAERRMMPFRIRKVTLSQIGPVLVMSPPNVFRAYILSFFQQIIGPLAYSFRPQPNEGLILGLLDRLLATIPYPDDEFLLENPKWPSARRDYVGTRHRMDALYGADFKLSNLDDDTLDHIDDFFGPLSFDTVAQAIHFSRHETITNRAGRNRFVTNESLEDLWRFPTLSIHGERNGLADLATIYRMEDILGVAGCSLQTHVVPDHGHQDCLIGAGSPAVFERIESFFESRTSKNSGEQTYKAVAIPPYLGPMLVVGSVEPDRGKVMISMGGLPGLGVPSSICMLPFCKKASGDWTIDQDVLRQLDPNPNGQYPNSVLWPFDSFDDSCDRDWYTYHIPDWVRRFEVRFLRVLLVYPQYKGLNNETFVDIKLDPNKIVSHLLDVKQMAITDEDGAAVERNLDAHRVVGKAIHAACDGMKEGPSGLPQGVVFIDHSINSRVGLNLALGSCQYAPGLLDRRLADEAWQRLNARLAMERFDGPHTELIILAGDQVYVDATAGLFDPTQAYDRYHNPYEVWLGNTNTKGSMQRVPVATILDDHEIYDNWEPVCPPLVAGSLKSFTDAGWVPLEVPVAKAAIAKEESDRDAGVNSFLLFQRATAPAVANSQLKPKEIPLWFDFEINGVAIFMLNSRSERLRRTAASKAPAQMLSDTQLRHLKDWLTKNDKRPKLIVEPSLLLPRHRRSAPALLAEEKFDSGGAASLRSDSWDGYLGSYYDLLSFISDHQIEQVVFLSGDEHLGLISEATIQGPTDEPVKIWTIHSPGLYTPYPFANAASSDFMPDECFTFQSGDKGKYQCMVKALLFDAPAFVMVSLTKDEATSRWTLKCEIDGPIGSNQPCQIGETIDLGSC